METVFEGVARPVASVLFVCFNQQELVATALKSIFEQTGLSLEILVSDDASTDETWLIVQRMAREYRGPHTIVLNRNRDRLGLGHVAFLALSARCDFQVQAHGDDIAYPQRCERLFHAAHEHGASVIGSAADRIDQHGRALEWHRDVVDTPLDVGAFVAGERHNGMFAAVMACHRDVFTKFPHLDGRYLYEGHGALLCFRAALLNKAFYLGEPLLAYRHHPQSWTRSRVPRLAGEWETEDAMVRKIYLRIAMQRDLDHWVSERPEEIAKYRQLRAAVNAQTELMLNRWNSERHRLYEAGWRPHWLLEQEYVGRYAGLRTKLNGPLAREFIYWIDRLARFIARRLL